MRQPQASRPSSGKSTKVAARITRCRRQWVTPGDHGVARELRAVQEEQQRDGQLGEEREVGRDLRRAPAGRSPAPPCQDRQHVAVGREASPEAPAPVRGGGWGRGLRRQAASGVRRRRRARRRAVEPPPPAPPLEGEGGSRVDQEGQLALDLLVAALGDLAVEQAGRVVAGEVVVGELRAGRDRAGRRPSPSRGPRPRGSPGCRPRAAGPSPRAMRSAASSWSRSGMSMP